MKFENLKDEINRSFSTTFGFPEGFVVARIRKNGGLNLRIGWRDIDIEPSGKVSGSGSLIDRGFKVMQENK